MRGKRSRGTPALEVLEEATRMLRATGSRAWGIYLGGTLPFLLAFLFFWADMSRSAAAGRHLLPGSFLLAVLFVAMKVSHVLFVRRLPGGVAERGAQPPALASVAALQAAVMPWSLVALPVALLITLPFGWCHAFYQSVCAVAAEEPDPGKVVPEARRCAALLPGQNLLLILALSAVSFFVFLNLVLAAFLVPRLLQQLLGIATPFSRGYHPYLNSTFLVTAAALTWLCTDPLARAAYALRVREARALRTGEDLLAELREVRTGAGALVLVLALLLAAPSLSRATTRPAPAAVDAARLERAIGKAMEGPEFAWRAPRPTRAKQEAPPGFWEDLRETLSRWISDLFRWLGKWLGKLFDLFPAGGGKRRVVPQLPFGLGEGVYLLLTLVAALGGVALYRFLRNRRTAPQEEGAEVTPLPDLTREEVRADLLPEEKWLALARDLLRQGEGRLALRALYLAGLSHLGEKGLVTILPSKADREYQRELARRGRDRGDLLPVFAASLVLFQRSWYGDHPVTTEAVEAMMANHRRIVTDAG